MKTIRTVIFSGHQSPYGLAHLEPLLTSHFQIVGVVLAPCSRWRAFEKSLSKQKNRIHPQVMERVKVFVKFLQMFLRTCSTVQLLKRYSMPCWFLENINSPHAIKKIQSLKPDLFICAAYPQIFSHELLSVPLKGAINSHPSLLPKYRGAHPHFWVLVNGEAETGLTAHYMTDRIDDGDIISQIPFPINCDDTYSVLYRKILSRVPQMVERVENFIIDGQGRSWRQDSGNATFYNNDQESDRKILWDIHEGKKIYNLARTEKAFFIFRSRKIIVKKISLLTAYGGPAISGDMESGTVVDVRPDAIIVKANDCYVSLLRVRAGFLNLNAKNFTRKYRLKAGEKFK